MVADEPEQHSEDEKKIEEEVAEHAQNPLYYLPSAVQLQSIFAVEIIAKRFPVNMPSVISTQSNINLEEVQVNHENFLAQVILNVQVGFTEEPHPFEISFKLVGIFAYTQEYNDEMVRQFLEQGSLSVMLPFARELLLSLCIRLQVPPLILQMVQLTSPPAMATETEDAPG